MSTGHDVGLSGRVEWEAGLPFRRVDSAEHAEVAATLVGAFQDSPVFGWLFPEEDSRVRCLLEFFEATLEWTAAHGGLVMASPRYECAYTVYPPGGDAGEIDVIRLPALRRRTAEIEALTGLAEHRRQGLPPHLYATYCGVKPEARGRGLFKVALSTVASWCDDRATPFYAEATSPHAAARYERAGFPRLGEPITVPGGPSLYPIWRPAG